METPGGGGLGDPSDRSIDDLAVDLEDQRISVARARLDYGNELTEKALKIISKSNPE
jgi:N-methylhydantoinase B/oxoprolinase/acetone carboxylase alpha subunit